VLGTAKERQRTSPPGRADELADIVLPDHDGNDVRLGDLWSEEPVALVWVRHYGCVHCRSHAVELEGARPEFDAAGVRVVLVGQATPRQAAHFRRRLEIDLPVLADESRLSYKAAGAKVATAGELLGPRSVSQGVRKTFESRGKVHQGRVIGHPAQLGGAMVIAPGGEVTWSHMAEDASDNATPDEILAAARQASTAG
jgi:prostamide/prostaglandin F2alpha synthase